MKHLPRVLNPNWWRFEWRYFRGQTPWDTNITPPEVMEFIANACPGRALDLGCGTGTNAITLARRGWRVTGVDISGRAIRAARQKAEKAGLGILFLVGDVAGLDPGGDPYDYVLDIGCLSTLNAKDRERYAASLPRLMRRGGWYMLYAWLPRAGRMSRYGIAPEDVAELFSPELELAKTVIGEEKGRGSAWYWFRKG